MTDRQQRPPARPTPRGTRGRGDSHGGAPGSLRGTIDGESRYTVGSSFEVLDIPRVSVASAYEVLADNPPLESACEVTADTPPRVRSVAAGDRQGSRFSRGSADTVIRVEATTSQPSRPRQQTTGPVGAGAASRRTSASPASASAGPRQEGRTAVVGRGGRGSSSRSLRKEPSTIQLRVEGPETEPRPSDRLALGLAAPGVAGGSHLTVDSGSAGAFSREHSIDTVLEAPRTPGPETPEDLAGLLRLSLSHGPARERSFFAGLSATGSFAQRRESRQTVETSLSDRGVFTTGLAGFLSTAKASSQSSSLTPSSVGTASLQPPTRSVSRGDIGQGSPSGRGANLVGASRDGRDSASREGVGRGVIGRGRASPVIGVNQDNSSRVGFGRRDKSQDQASNSQRSTILGVGEGSESQGVVGRGDIGQESISRMSNLLDGVRQDNASQEGVGQGSTSQAGGIRGDIAQQGSDSRRAIRLVGVREDNASQEGVRQGTVVQGNASLVGGGQEHKSREGGIVKGSATRMGASRTILGGVRQDNASRGGVRRSDTPQGSATRVRGATPSGGGQGQDRASQDGGNRRPASSATSRKSLTEEVPTVNLGVGSSAEVLGGHGDTGQRSSGVSGGRERSTIRTSSAGAGALAATTAGSFIPAGGERSRQQDIAVHRRPSKVTAPDATRTGDGRGSGTKTNASSALASDPFSAMLRMGMGDFRTSVAPTAPAEDKGAPEDKWAASAVIWRAETPPGGAPRSASLASRSASPQGTQGRAGGARLAADHQEARHVDHVGVWEGKAFVLQPPTQPPPPQQAEQAERAGLRRSRSAVFSLKRPPLTLAGPAASTASTDPGTQGLIDHIDKVLPKGLRNLLLQLENHADLGVMALYAATLQRHRRLSSALRHLQKLECRSQSPEKVPKSSQPAQPARSRWGRWRRGLLLPMALKPASPPPPPPLPPTQSPDLLSVERCLQDALEQGLGPGDSCGTSSTAQAPGVEYSAAWSADACRILAAFVTRAAAKLDLKRYKTACVVRIIEKRQQRFCSHFAALWNSECDAYCSVVYETDTLVAHALIMLVYWD